MGPDLPEFAAPLWLGCGQQPTEGAHEGIRTALGARVVSLTQAPCAPALGLVGTQVGQDQVAVEEGGQL
jgi:hypothetical protein